MLSSHLRLYVPSRFLTKMFYAFFMSPVRAACSFSIDDRSNMPQYSPHMEFGFDVQHEPRLS